MKPAKATKTKQYYGRELAEKVYDYLVRNHSIKHGHSGYCGTGLVYREGVILYSHIEDGQAYPQGIVYKGGRQYAGIIRSFKSKTEFTAWLAKQTDDSLSGKEVGDPWYKDNQRITRSWLESL